MKKHIVILLALGTAFTASCSYDEKSENNSEEILISFESSSDIEASSDADSANPIFADSVTDIPENAAYRKNEYYSYKDGFSGSNVYFYDYHDNIILELLDPYTDGDHPRRCEYSYEYNSDNTVSSKTSVNSYGNVYKTCYEYNSNGTPAKITHYTNDTLYSTLFYEYDEYNNPIKVTKDAKASPSNYDKNLYYEYEYNGDGNILIKKEYSSENKLKYTETYTYNEAGIITEKEFSDNILNEYHKYIYSYNAENQLIKEELFFNDSFFSTTEYEYTFY